MMNSSPLEIKSLTIGFNKPLFVNLDLKLESGQFITLMGENGSGKTSLIRSLMGVLKPHRGDILFWGKKRSQWNPALLNQSVGWVISDRETYPPFLTVGGLLDSLRPLYPTWNRSLEGTLLAGFKLEKSKTLSHLSLGETSKIKLLKALAFEPQLLILDELTANLSQDSKKVVLETLLGLFADKKMSVFYISHSIDEAVRLSDRVFILKNQGLESLKVNL